MKSNYLNNKTAVFIEKALVKHGEKYNYSKVEYKGSNQKVCIICPDHGEYYQLPYNHLAGKECLKCSYEKRGENLKNTNHNFIEKAKVKHGNKYDYSKLIYVNAKIKVCITCYSHGDFYQLPSKHLSGNTCPKCADEIRNLGNKKTNDDFIEESKIIHENKYCYDKVKYINAKTNIIISCDKHGEFLCTPNNHLKGKGCPKCVGKNKSTEDWIVEASQRHGNKYSYLKVDYKKCGAKVCITCFDHGDFWQVAQYHLSGNGCPKCKQSKLEKSVSIILDKLKLKYEFQYSPLFLKKGKGQQTIDFYIPDLNLAIECQGEQHFRPIDFAGKGEEWATQAFEKNKKRDEQKLNKCLDNNIEMIYVVDNDEYFDRKYHFDVTEPFSGNKSYLTVNVINLEHHIKHLIDKSMLFE